MMCLRPAFRRALSAGLLTGLLTAAADAAPGPSATPAAATVPGLPATPGAVPAARTGGRKAVGEIGSSREPIAIDADRLDVYDKEGRAVFTGNVVAIQGDTTMKCSVMSVSYESGRVPASAGGEKPAAPAAGGLGNDSSIKKIDCRGPVTITTKTQTATGDRAEFDRVVNKVFLIGNAALSDGPNVTRGERVAYNLTTGVANVEGGRVRALIVPGSQKDKDGKPKTR